MALVPNTEKVVYKSNIKAILQAYYSATQSDPKWYKAWHTWSLANFEVVGYLETQNSNLSDGVLAQSFVTHVTSAVEGTMIILASFCGLTLPRLLPIDCIT